VAELHRTGPRAGRGPGRHGPSNLRVEQGEQLIAPSEQQARRRGRGRQGQRRGSATGA
jgi:hypothetical protein